MTFSMQHRPFDLARPRRENYPRLSAKLKNKMRMKISREYASLKDPKPSRVYSIIIIILMDDIIPSYQYASSLDSFFGSNSTMYLKLNM